VQGLVHDLLDRLAGQRSGGLRPGRVPSRRSPGMPLAKYRSCQRLTVTLLLPAERATAITPSRSANHNTVRDRQTTFCRVPPRDQPVQRRPIRSRQPDACVFCFPADSHTRPNLGIVC
jgi:hypothetical protein